MLKCVRLSVAVGTVSMKEIGTSHQKYTISFSPIIDPPDTKPKSMKKREQVGVERNARNWKVNVERSCCTVLCT